MCVCGGGGGGGFTKFCGQIPISLKSDRNTSHNMRTYVFICHYFFVMDTVCSVRYELRRYS